MTAVVNVCLAQPFGYRKGQTFIHGRVGSAAKLFSVHFGSLSRYILYDICRDADTFGAPGSFI